MAISHSDAEAGAANAPVAKHARAHAETIFMIRFNPLPSLYAPEAIASGAF